MLSLFFFALASGTMEYSNYLEKKASGWINKFDENFDWKASEGYFQCGMDSEWSGHHFDRRFQFRECRWTEEPGQRQNIYTQQGWCNYYDGEMQDCKCPAGTAVIGWHSQHSNEHEDRQWKITCGKTDFVEIEPHMGGALGFSANAPYDGQNHQITCTAGYAVCGMHGVHLGRDDHNNIVEDRAYGLMCCRVKTRADVCASMSVDIHTLELTQESNPRNVIVDKVVASGCGSDAEVKHTVNNERSKSQEFEEELSFSQSFEQSFTREIGFGIGITFKKSWGANAIGFASEASASLNFDFKSTRSKTESKNEERVKRNKQVTSATFQHGYEYSAKAGNIVTSKAMQWQFDGRINWWGDATCRNDAGEVLETAKVSGEYKGVTASEITTVISTTMCPVDGWNIRKNTYCSAHDWLQEDGAYVHAIDKYSALEKCRLREDCGCVVDRDCTGEDNGFFLCGTGCEEKLVYSDNSCTLTPKNECRCDHPDGGPLSTQISCDDGTTGNCGAGKMCTKGTVEKDLYLNAGYGSLSNAPMCIDIPQPGALNVPISATCFMENKHYWDSWTTYKKLYNVPNPAACKQHCVDEDECKNWSWRNALYSNWGPANTCFLKTAAGSQIKELDGSVSGPKHCVDRRRSSEPLRRLLGDAL